MAVEKAFDVSLKLLCKPLLHTDLKEGGVGFQEVHGWLGKPKLYLHIFFIFLAHFDHRSLIRNF
jgi:hypothetical protein